MKSIKVLFAAMAIAFPSVAFAAGAEFDGRLYQMSKPGLKMLQKAKMFLP